MYHAWDAACADIDLFAVFVSVDENCIFIIAAF
jgi:hypothetical protein